MKPIKIKELEKINIDSWNLIKDTPTEQIYTKDHKEKRLEIFKKYTIEKNFENDKLHGMLVGRMNQSFLHFPNIQSKIYLIENYYEGKQQGLSLSFYEDGTKAQQEYKNAQLHGKWEGWYANGRKEIEKNYVNGVYNGEQFEWYENGQLKLKENFSNGIQVGESLKFLENGMLKRKKSYENGKIEGVVFELWDFKGRVVDGGIYSETIYQNDIEQGKENVFYPDKTKMREGNYLNGLEQGERIWWNRNGTISISEFYNNGELEGERCIYDENGNKESVQIYKNGERIS